MTEYDGKCFWACRKHGLIADQGYPPVVFVVDDDGKINALAE